jgi:hypothetical protein
MSDTSDDRVHEVAEALIGTAGSLAGYATEEEMNNPKFCERLEYLCFECVECGWWCREDECSGDNVCNDCAEAGDDDEAN